VAGEAEEFTARVRGNEAKEAFAVFLEKRPPNFTNAASLPPQRRDRHGQ
jgi:hypothetical protein